LIAFIVASSAARKHDREKVKNGTHHFVTNNPGLIE